MERKIKKKKVLTKVQKNSDKTKKKKKRRRKLTCLKNFNHWCWDTQKNIQGLRLKDLLFSKISISKPLRNYQLLWGQSIRSICSGLSAPPKVSGLKH